MAQTAQTSPALSGTTSWLQRQGNIGWLIALLPLGVIIYLLTLVERITAGEILTISYAWVPSFGINLSFYLDGLSLVFALLVSGIGALVLVYAGGYLAGHHQLGRFYIYLLLFMGSMLGLVLAGNLLTMFVFWEMTSLSSYLLIGFNHRQEKSRASALQALLVTGGGGLALLAGLILLSQVAGGLEFTAVLSQGDVVRADALYTPLLILVLLGAFTKSAQFPFHIWLPNAMAAPTPVSAYLHSATMVKAGVYLLARLSPVLGGTALWLYSVTAFGTVTMLLGAYLAWQQTDLKRILAYSTVSALGTLMLLLGLGTSVAVKATILFLIVHSLYKGALFMAAGAIDHETGTRDITKLRGLRRAMPVTFVAVVLASLSMAGALPLFIGYIGKKLIYDATLNAPANIAFILTGAALLANVLTVVVAGLVAYRPFFGQPSETPKKAHEGPPSLWLGPIVLSILGLVLVVLIEVVPDSLFKPLLVSSATAIMTEFTSVKLAVWSGFNSIFWLSVATLVGGIAIYAGREPLKALVSPLNGISAWGPERGFEGALDGMKRLAAWQTRFLQNGYLRIYLLTILIFTIVLTGYTLLTRGGLTVTPTWTDLRFYEAAVSLMIFGGIITAVLAKTRLVTIVSLGVVGYGIALIFVLFGAPDLAMTQLAIETLTVILLMLVLARLPKFSRLSNTATRLRDGVIALGVGGLVTTIILTVTSLPFQSTLTPFFAENSWLAAKGRNVVNVILVDFRALDTLGEIAVLAIAALGVYVLMKNGLNRDKER